MRGLCVPACYKGGLLHHWKPCEKARSSFDPRKMVAFRPHGMPPGGGGISTQGDDLAELQAMIRDAIEAYFDVAETDRPDRFRLHFIEDPSLVCA